MCVCCPGARDILCVLLGLAAGYWLFCAPGAPAPAAAWAAAGDAAYAAARAVLGLLPPETYAALWRTVQK